MNGRAIFIQVTYFIIFIGLQFFITRNLVIFNYAFCFAYVGFILLLPKEIGPIWLLLLALGYGLVTDVFYDTLGMHAAASVLLAFLRPVHMKFIMPSGGYEQSMDISIKSMGTNWFIRYAAPLIFVHHLLLFSIEAANMSLFPIAFVKALFSTLFTLVVVLLVHRTFYSSK